MLKPKNISKTTQKVLPIDECLAKTVKQANGSVIKGVSVSIHCQIVGHIARELINRQPQWLRDTLFPKGSELVAAAHDIGKISPHFQEKIYSAVGDLIGVGKAELDNTLGGHAAISQACIQDIDKKFISQILGRHHGTSPNSIGCSTDEIYGGIEWQKSRMNLLDDLKTIFDCDWPIVRDENQANAISGLVCVADWIGSCSLFDGFQPNEKIDKISYYNLISKAVDNAGFVGFKVRQNLSFTDIFPFTKSPREAQTKLIQAVESRGVYILEAPMGIGKTEAALYATYKALSQGATTGIYFALPTQLTSDKIYDRMNNFLEKVLTEDCKFRSLLLHSSAWLRDTELGEEGMPGKGWFNSSKRGLLAPFAVGTIDQALMGVMNVKHGFVRTFGLAGKVVILDEVHSYDCYTGTIMDKLVQVLQALQCTVIILSATLTAERRADLLGQKSNETSYPLVSALPKKSASFYLPVKHIDSATVSVCVKNDFKEALEEAIIRAERGEQVLWIENIVAESQDRFKIIAARAQECVVKIECGLLHSRFLRTDRKRNEEKWVNTFGKDGYDKRRECGRILVGTQVLEQSLDIDADFLITRICPTDMLFQRIGRLWRHREADELRPNTAKREVWILAPSLKDNYNNLNIWGKSEKVYMPYILYRSLDVWQKKQQVSLPKDIRPMLEATYAEQQEFGILNKCKADVEANRVKLAGLARIGLSTAGQTLPESKASTRYSETESCEVLLIRKKYSNETGITLVLLNGKKLLLPQNVKRKDHREWRSLAAELQQNVVLVPAHLAPSTSPHQIQWLKDFVYLGDRDESPFRVAIVREDGTLCGIDQGIALQSYELTYSEIYGYGARKNNNNDTPNDLW
ncbi:CRISPR-associated helicase Cas3' [candidate division WOR-3 bacterium]|nr:CRISPR-associated helicase Cas3' [candidate division WOR-3 bacterium]